jgi:hypothetical protein
MVGQVHVDLVPTDKFASLLDAFRESGIEVVSRRLDADGMGEFVCRRGRSEIPFDTYIYKERPDSAFVVVAIPPQTLLPWRWPADYRLFNDMLEILDQHDQPYLPPK